jgi:hypothetical protein
MRRAIVPTNATARYFQLAALLLVGASVFLVLAHALANGRTPAAVAVGTADAGPRTLGAHSDLPHVTYRAEACGGDYVCDERGAWEIIPSLPAASPRPHLLTTEVGKHVRSQ